MVVDCGKWLLLYSGVFPTMRTSWLWNGHAHVCFPRPAHAGHRQFQGSPRTGLRGRQGPCPTRLSRSRGLICCARPGRAVTACPPPASVGEGGHRLPSACLGQGRSTPGPRAPAPVNAWPRSQLVDVDDPPWALGLPLIMPAVVPPPWRSGPAPLEGQVLRVCSSFRRSPVRRGRKPQHPQAWQPMGVDRQ